MDAEKITNPERIRALAHPVRLALLDYLGTVEDATATQCAKEVGESVASCSFHLHTLAKYGYIEAAPKRGRERPWRTLTRSGIDVRPDDEVPGSRHAVAELAGLQVTRQAERVRAYLQILSDQPEEWIQASTVTASSFWATPEEAAEISARLQQIADERFAGREEDPSKRPEGARRVQVFATLVPEPTESPSAQDTSIEEDR